MDYLGIRPIKPKVAVFDFTGCEGCELQLVNKEDTLIDFLSAIDLSAFREASSQRDDHYDIALIDGAITRSDEITRLQSIRSRATILVALGTCACFGGVNKLKNTVDPAEANRAVYGNQAKETLPARAAREVVPVDFSIPGCPVSKAEIESLVKHLAWDIPFQFPAYPVCMECKQRFTPCVFEKGLLCMGPISQAGCHAPCPIGGLGCWGCRGPCADPNYEAFFTIVKGKGFSAHEINERLNFFGAFGEVKAS